MPAHQDAIADDLTELEAAALDYLVRTARPGFCPSHKEISRAVGLGGRGCRIVGQLNSLMEKAALVIRPIG